MNAKTRTEKIAVGKQIKSLYIQYIFKQSMLTKKYKVYRLYMVGEKPNGTLHKKQLVKKNLTKFEAENLIYLLTH